MSLDIAGQDKEGPPSGVLAQARIIAYRFSALFVSSEQGKTAAPQPQGPLVIADDTRKPGHRVCRSPLCPKTSYALCAAHGQMRATELAGAASILSLIHI